jgi:GAF domain-containing protein
MPSNSFNLDIIPANEPERLRELAYYNSLLVSLEESKAFNHIAEMAARMFEVPIAIVNMVGAEQVRALAAAGEISIGTEVARGVSLCSLAILNNDPTVFKDALEEPCLLANPLVVGNFGLRFYAAAPITTKAGNHIGALCLVDKAPREFSEIDQKILAGLARIVMEELDERFGKKV